MAYCEKSFLHLSRGNDKKLEEKNTNKMVGETKFKRINKQQIRNASHNKVRHVSKNGDCKEKHSFPGLR